MHRYFSDYRWKDGVPQGVQPLDESENQEISYKIVTDPYRKRFTVEKYVTGQFETVVYDSLLLDFRKLSPKEQNAWQREVLSESEDKVVAIIRNIEDRVILVEHHHYEKGRCRECRIFSPQGFYLSTHKLFYTEREDSFNGVLLLDRTERPVMRKEYTVDESGEFAELLKEEWGLV